MSPSEADEVRSLAMDTAQVVMWLIDTVAPPVPEHVNDAIKGMFESIKRIKERPE